MHRVLYEAGTAARAAQQPASALLLLNLYLDVAEAIDERNPSALPDASPFAGCDAPWQVQLPAAHYVPKDAQEAVWELFCCFFSPCLFISLRGIVLLLPPPFSSVEEVMLCCLPQVRAWVLEHALDPALHPSLPALPCAQCGIALPAVNARCNNCGAAVEMCIVTGASALHKCGTGCKARPLVACSTGAPLGAGQAWRPPNLRGVVASQPAWERACTRTRLNPVTGKPL